MAVPNMLGALKSRAKAIAPAEEMIEQADTIASDENRVHQLHEMLSGAYKRRKLETIDDSTTASACLKPLLLALEWTGMSRHLIEALPHLEPVADINDIRSLLARLNFNTTRRPVRLSELRPGMLPCLFVQGNNSNIEVILKMEDDGRLFVFDGDKKEFRLHKADNTRGDAYLISEMDVREASEAAAKFGWINTAIGRFKMVLLKLMAQTFAINVLALSVPLYTMNVYDKAIGAKSATTLFFFLSGVLIIMGLEMLLRGVRSRTVAFLGARFESVVTINAFQQLLHLPVAMTENSPISAQITRLKQFGSIRDLFAGQLGNAILDLPFAVVFLAAIFAIGGSLGYLPLGLLGVFLLIAGLTIPLARRRIRKAGDAKSQAREFLMELTEKYPSVMENAAEDVWIERYKKICSASLLRQFEAQQFNMTLQSVSQLLVMATGVLTIALGTLQAMQGDLSAGALIAVIALIWRLLSPIQAVFLGLNRIGQTLETLKQINRLMSFKPERQPGQIPTFDRKFNGKISLVGLGFRYAAHAEPAIRGISLDIEPGQIVAITGPSGAGKSTLLKLIAGLYQPQAGMVRVDGLDLRQIDTCQYRQAIGYVSESLEFFHGTIAQNLKLADPLVTREEMQAALEKAGAKASIEALPDGLDTRMTTADRNMLPDGLRQQLSLARAYIKSSSIYLLDDPGGRLDDAGDKAFISYLKTLSGKSTVLLVTHRPSQMNCADRVVIMDQGLIVADGTPDQVVPQILAQTKKAQC
jgi:ABC-type bacteriocin/lantibiotic exporter with double-glycine peptidase domain